MNEREAIERIELYINNDLNDAEREAFEAELTVNESLAEQYRLHRDLHVSMADRQRPQVEAAIETAAQNYFDNKIRRFNPRNVMIAAAAVAAAIVAIFVMINAPSPTPFTAGERLAMGYADHYPSMVLRSGEKEATQLDDAFKAYTAKNYSEAARLFAEWQISGPLQDDALYFGGLSHVLAGEYEDGERVLSQYEFLNLARHANEAQWYLSLSLIAQEKYTRARPILARLKSVAQGKTRKQATLLLEELPKETTEE